MIAIGKRCANSRNILCDEFVARIKFKGGIIVRIGRAMIRSRVISHFSRIEHTIAISILPVIDAIAVEVLVCASKAISTTRRTVDEEIGFDIDVRRTFRITTHDVATV